MRIGVHGALEFHLGVLWKSFLTQKLSQAIVECRRSRFGAKTVNRLLDLRIERIVRIEKLLDEKTAGVRIVVVMHAERAAKERRHRHRHDQGSSHHDSWIGFAFSFTFPSTTSTRKPTTSTL